MRKIIHIFLSLVIVYASTTSAYANSSVGGWSAVDVITAGATNTINAAKTAGGKALKSAVTVAPQAGKVGKHLIKGGGAAALAFAMVELADGALDWVLDPANNAVRYTVAGTADPMDAPAGKRWVIVGLDIYGGNATSLGQQLCQMPWVNEKVFDKLKRKGTSDSYEVFCGNPRWSAYQGVVALVEDPTYDPAAPSDNEKSIPIDVVAAKVISNAEAGHPDSQEAVKATALEGFAAGEHDAALDAAATEAGTENPPKDPDAPAEPFDPAGIISAINALKALLAGILSAITGLSDLFSDTPSSPENTDVPVDDLPPTKGASDFDVNYINFGGQCPVLPSFDIGIAGASSALTFDMTPLCDMAVKIRPAVIAIAYFIGLGVIASAIRET